MCGIVGHISTENKACASSVSKALQIMRHRGPDGEGLWCDQQNKVALGHTRLSLIAAENGKQPLISEDGTIVAVVNGEFYGFEEIRQNLRQKGHVFQTGSDSEIVVHLYEEYGYDCLTYLRGEFSFALWDGQKKRLFCARDRFGIKPFCFMKTGDADFAFASEVKALCAMGYRPSWNRKAFFHASCMQYTMPAETLFEGIEQLRPGHFLVWQDAGIRTHRYWDFDWPAEPRTTQTLSEQECIEGLRENLEEAVRLRLRADAPLCCHLSGGLDSSSILGFAATLSPKPLACYTVCFEDEAYNEKDLAQESAERMGVRFRSVDVKASDIFDVLFQAVYAAEGLAINGHLSAKYLLNKVIAEDGYKVALTGEGADEILGGYPHLREDLFKTQRLGHEMVSRLYADNHVLQGIQLPSGCGLSLNAIERKLGYIPTFLAAKATLGYKIQPFLQEAFRADFASDDAYEALIEETDIAGQLVSRNVVHQSSYIWSKLTLANYILRTLGDGMEMAHSVEGRLPFLDHKVVEFCRQIPVSLKIHEGVEKYVLREAAKDQLTKNVYRNRKHSFMAPPVGNMREPLARQRMKEIFGASDFERYTFFNQRELLAWIDQVKDPSEYISMEPVLMMALTSYALGCGYGMEV